MGKNMVSLSDKIHGVVFQISLLCFFLWGIYIYNENRIVDENTYLYNTMTRFLREKYVKHKDLFPMNSRDIWGSILVGLGTMIAASGGIGGGGILVPLLILVFGFHPKYAIPLSNFTILGSSITNVILNVYKRHPNADRPLVDWDMILVMEPLTMGGAIVGAILSKILPDWILVGSLVVLLAYTTKTTMEKGISQFNAETKKFELERKSQLVHVVKSEEDVNYILESSSLLRDDDDNGDGDDDENGDIVDEKNNHHNQSINHSDDEEKNSFSKYRHIDPKLKEIMEDERYTSPEKVGIVAILVIVVLLLNMLKGGGGNFPSPLGIQCGSSAYWILTVLVFVWVVGVSLFVRQGLIEKWKLKRRLNYRYVIGDVEWNERNTIIYPCLCFFAGFFAGLFGVGGGIVKGPLMLQMEIHPLVASGTVAVMIMFTSVGATTMFIAFGTMTWDYAIYLFILGLITTVIGQFGVSYLVEKYHRISLVSLSIGLVVAISTVLLAIQSIFSLIEAQEGGGDSSSLCKN